MLKCNAYNLVDRANALTSLSKKEGHRIYVDFKSQGNKVDSGASSKFHRLFPFYKKKVNQKQRNWFMNCLHSETKNLLAIFFLICVIQVTLLDVTEESLFKTSIHLNQVPLYSNGNNWQTNHIQLEDMIKLQWNAIFKLCRTEDHSYLHFFFQFLKHGWYHTLFLHCVKFFSGGPNIS